MVCRWGGEEIVVALKGADTNVALEKAELLRNLIETKVSVPIQTLEEHTVTMSIGIATSENGINFEELIERSDSAMYQAKNKGRNQVVTYDVLQ